MSRELKVEDALLYLDQVKLEFGDQPHIYNEFLDIMKTFKTQQIDTPGVIRRVSNLFRGNRRLVLGFNTFLPEGYKIELPDGGGPAVAVYRAPGSNVAQVLTEGQAPPGIPPRGPAHMQIPMRHNAIPGQRLPGPSRDPPYGGPMPPMQHSQGPPLPPPARGPSGPPGAGGIDGPARGQHAMDELGRGHAVMRQGPLPERERDMPDRMVAPPVNGSSGPIRQGSAYAEQTAQHSPQQQAATQGGEQPGAVEFDHAINYVTTIKKRFSSEPYTYKKFLEILHTYQKEQRGIKEVLDEVSTLFADHPDLLKEFTYFLPDAVQAQAKAQLDQVAKESEARKRAQAKQAIMHTAQGMQRQAQSVQRTPSITRAADYDSPPPPVSFAGSQGRTSEYENNIIRSAHFGIVSFAPVRPPRKGELAPAQAALKKGRPTSIPVVPIVPNTSETAYFQRVRDHLNRKELAADKPVGSKRHTPYTEFLKCLHLFACGIVNKEELILLLKGLLMQGHAPKSGVNAGGGNVNPSVAHTAAELLRDFEEVLVGRGPYADQESAFKDKSKYGGSSIRDFDFSGSEWLTPSYATYPSDYPASLFLAHPGQTDVDMSVLNSAVVCLGDAIGSKPYTQSLEAYDGVRLRRNVYEEALFRIEDDRYEVDMAIERNAQAMRQIEPFAEEVQALREQEEKDGQPIGRLQYQLNRYAMNTIHINAVARLYGDKGDEILQHLVENPLIVLPILYQRLKQKDTEWRNKKTEHMKAWNDETAANYEGSRDVRCFFNRRALEKRFSRNRLLDECRRARLYSIYPEWSSHDPVVVAFSPTYGLAASDASALLFQPFVATMCKVNHSHKEAFQIVADKMKNSGVSPMDLERVGRIWAEFVVPWFDYPAHWAMDEVRTSFRGSLNSHLVRYAPGQRVSTIYGPGAILAFRADSATSDPLYRVRLAFGTAFLSPWAILHTIPSKDQPFARRDGSMVRVETLADRDVSLNARVDEKYMLLFGTESVYVFLRVYLVLCSLLDSIREHCEMFDAPDDPAKKYCKPNKDADKDTPSPKLDYSTILSGLQKVACKNMSLKDFESLGRKVAPAKVHEIASLPEFVDRCVDALVATAREDCLLQLYDYCQYRIVDPVAVRARCLSVSREALYRIQYDTSTGTIYFNFLPRSLDLLIMPVLYLERHEDETKEVVPMETEDPIDEFEDDDDDPPVKRAKI